MIILPQPVNEAIEQLENAGFDAYIVARASGSLCSGTARRILI